MGKRAADQPLGPREEALVRALLPAVRELVKRMDDDLKQHRLSHTEYLVLMYLSESPERRMSLSDLATSCHQSVSAISRTVGRLEQSGWVARERSSVDARSSEAVLTRAGLRHLQKAWPTHLRTIRRSLLDHVADQDLESLATALQAVASGVDVPEDKQRHGAR